MPTEKEMAKKLKDELPEGVTVASILSFENYCRDTRNTYGTGVLANVLDLAVEEEKVEEEKVEEEELVVTLAKVLEEVRVTDGPWVAECRDVIRFFGKDMLNKVLDLVIEGRTFKKECWKRNTEEETLEKELAALLNKHNDSDFVLAQYLLNCLEAWNVGIKAREEQ